jgi:hypothetical protein
VQAARPRQVLPFLLILYGIASLAHFVHNAELLAEYPNLPAWLTRAQVYVAWLGITVIGALGYLLTYAKREIIGLGVLACYAALGLDALAHYSRAPITAHTTAMNLTIWFEVISATLVLVVIAARLRECSQISRRGA